MLAATGGDMADGHELSVTVERIQGLEFKVTFDWPEAGELRLDEPEPLGRRRGPNAERLLAAAVGNCLTASLLFCLQRSKVELGPVTTTVTGRTGRNEKGRLRVELLAVRIALPVGGGERERLERCLSLFEEYCTVTASLRRGIPVAVEVVDRDGGMLFESVQ
jgi:organic hydroperoxide reductase OsmC/OhrA